MNIRLSACLILNVCFSTHHVQQKYICDKRKNVLEIQFTTKATVSLSLARFYKMR
jgi:hypothetical protein